MVSILPSIAAPRYYSDKLLGQALDLEARKLLQIGANNGSAEARRILEHTPAYGFQVDLDAAEGVFDIGTNTIRLNPYAGDRLRLKNPVQIAGNMVHEAGHGRGLPRQIPPRSSSNIQGAGYNEFRAFFEEGVFYHRLRQYDPRLLEGLSPGTKRFAEGFSDAFTHGGPEAARKFVDNAIKDLRYHELYDSRWAYARGTSRHRGGSNGRLDEALLGGTPPGS